MAYTKIFPIRTRLDRRVRYALNGKKTALEAAAGYALDAAKTESVLFTDAFNCGLAASCAECTRPNGVGARTKTGCRAITSSSPSGPER